MQHVLCLGCPQQSQICVLPLRHVSSVASTGPILDSGHAKRAEVERLVSLGAKRVDWNYPEDADFVVLADPDGNVFCVVA
jgi:hypothetical protein